MSRLRIDRVNVDATVHDWQYVHDLVIPTHHRSLDEVRERCRRHVFEVARLGETLIGCTTVRPPTGETPVATVIARVLPGHRGRQFGAELYERGLAGRGSSTPRSSRRWYRHPTRTASASRGSAAARLRGDRRVSVAGRDDSRDRSPPEGRGRGPAWNQASGFGACASGWAPVPCADRSPDVPCAQRSQAPNVPRV